MRKHELSQYPNLIEAEELTDEANRTVEELMAYSSYLNKIMAWNMTMIESYDEGFDEGLKKGIEKGIELGKSQVTELIFSIYKLLKEKQLSVEEIALKVGVSIEYVNHWKQKIEK